MTAPRRVGAVVLCRFGSRRLPGKILHQVGDASILEHVARRIRRSFDDDAIVVATTVGASDDAVADAARALGLAVFRGPEDDVALRFLCAAVSQRLDVAVRVNGDNLFGCRALIDRVVDLCVDDTYDLVSNVPGRTFPHGMSVEALDTRFYRSHLSDMWRPEHAEHVTKYFYDNEHLGRRHLIVNDDAPSMEGLRLAVDTADDLELARAMWDAFDVDPADADLDAVARAWARTREHGASS